MIGEIELEKKTIGTVLSVKKQWWLKVNAKPVRAHALDGAIFPHVIKVRYTVDETEYVKRMWVGAGKPVPTLNAEITVVYDENKPSKCKLV